MIRRDFLLSGMWFILRLFPKLVEINCMKIYVLYDQLKHDLIIPLEDGDIDAANAASLSNKLLQMANGAVYDENKEVRMIHNHKLEMLEDLIESANGQPVLIQIFQV